MTARELLDWGAALPDAYEDYPFEEEIPVLRRRSTRKWFAVFLRVEGRLCVNLKCDPQRAELYRQVYEGVTPGWHMNKTHWNSVRLDGGVPDGDLQEMVRHSYELVGPKRRR